ncbi:hypothetical protein HK102_000515 [Quaeritorhiza haematococci]|nr:hypothetical protein HK102_000515 [Quaeritorhiza haematococci]
MKHRVQLIQLGILQKLFEFTASADIGTRRAAIACVAATTEVEELHPALRTKEYISKLVSLLSPEQPPEVQDEAAFALTNFARDFNNKTEIRKCNGIQALVSLLESPDPDVQKNSALALGAVLEDFSNRAAFRETSGILALLHLLSSEHREIQENALTCLVRCSEEYGSRIELRKANALKRFIDQLSQSTEQLPENHNITHLLLLCIANCMDDLEMGTALVQSGGIPTIVKYLQSDDLQNRQYAALILCRAGRIERNHQAIRDNGGLTHLVANLSHTDPQTAAHAAMTITVLGKTDINQLDFLKGGAAEALVKNLSHENSNVKAHSVLALSSLCSNPKIRSRVRSLDAISTIAQLPVSTDPQVSLNACECIANMAEDLDSRIEIAHHKGLENLVSAMNTPELKQQSMAMLALARCMQEREVRAKIGTIPDALKRMVEFLSSKDAHVSKTAVYALSQACAQHEMNAATVCELGAIEAILELSKDPKKNCEKFALDALETILNYS